MVKKNFDFDFFTFVANFLNFLLTCLVRGVMIIVPFILTWYVISTLLGVFNNVIGLGMHMSGIIFILFTIMLAGYFARSFVVNLLYNFAEVFIMRVPFLNFLYSSVKDFTFAFIDKKVKFDKPVLICVNVSVDQKEDIKKIGFITNENINDLGLKDHVAVFVPESFSFSLSGDFLLIPRKNLIPIEKVDGAQVIRFVITAGFINNRKSKKKRG